MTGEQFKQALDALQWQQADFAERTGMTRQTINAWAAGRTPLPLWAGAYLGAMLDLAMLRDKYLTPARLLQGEPKTPGTEAL
jgi:transcriptional regulator with XRE-family HTH domain